jgi:hypothetical protein
MKLDPPWLHLEEAWPAAVPDTLHSEDVLVALMSPQGRPTRRTIAYAIFRPDGERTGKWRDTGTPPTVFFDDEIHGWTPIPPLPKQ